MLSLKTLLSYSIQKGSKVHRDYISNSLHFKSWGSAVRFSKSRNVTLTSATFSPNLALMKTKLELWSSSIQSCSPLLGVSVTGQRKWIEMLKWSFQKGFSSSQSCCSHYPSQPQHLLTPSQVLGSFPEAVILYATRVSLWDLIWLAEEHNAWGRHLDVVLHIIEGPVINNSLHI